MKKIIKDYWKKFIIILVFPFVLDWILRFIWWIPIPIKESASLDEWLGFLGAYFGVIGAIAVVWWQHIENKKQFEKQLAENKQLAEMQIESQKEMFEKQLNEEKEKETLKALNFFYTVFNSIDTSRLLVFFSHIYPIIFEFNENIYLKNDNDFRIILPLEESIASNLFINITENANFTKLFTLFQKIISFQDRIKKYILETKKDFNEIQLKKIDTFYSGHTQPTNYINIEEEKTKFKNSHSNFIINNSPFQEYVKNIAALIEDLYTKISFIKTQEDFINDNDFLLYSSKLSYLSIYIPEFTKILEEINDVKEILKEKI